MERMIGKNSGSGALKNIDDSNLPGSNIDIKDLKNVVMIQCVGSRVPERPYCSRICCTVAIKNALKLKELNPDINIHILYRDIRTYGLREKYYYNASEKGIRFVRYEPEKQPEIVLRDSGSGAIKNLIVKTHDYVLGDEIELNSDLVVLSTAILPQPDNEELGKMLKVPLSKDKFFLEAHMKLRPVDFATDGVYVCGFAHSSKFIDECISQAAATAARAATVLAKDTLESEGIISFVMEDECRGCGMCVEACPYNAIELKEVNRFGHLVQVAKVNEILCKGCGTCAAACLSGAIQQRKFEDRQIMRMIESFLVVEDIEEDEETTVTVATSTD
jgi:heterodisulfide reductase subunit A